MLRQIAFAAAVAAAWPAPPAAAAPGAVSTGAHSVGSNAVAPQQADATFAHYKFRDGETLPQLRLHYATLGQPHRSAQGTIDNAVLLLHWTGANGQALLTPEYQAALFAPGAPLDVSRYFVILPDAIGHGRSSKPSNGLRAAFPHYGYGDIVDLQHRLVTETLGIRHLRAVVGMSMGCMNAWQWAEDYPDAMNGIMPVACFPSSIAGRNLLWRRMVVDGIKSDLAWASGNYQQQPPSVSYGLEILRLMIDGVPHLQAAAGTREGADGYIRGMKEEAAGLDANDLIYSLESSGDFDPEPGLSRVKTKVLAVNFADDEFYRDSLRTLQRGIGRVRGGRLVVLAVSGGSVGHMSMAHPALWADQARDFVAWLSKS